MTPLVDIKDNMLQVQTAEDSEDDESNNRTRGRAAAAFAKVETETANSHMLLRLGGGGNFSYIIFSSIHQCQLDSTFSFPLFLGWQRIPTRLVGRHPQCMDWQD